MIKIGHPIRLPKRNESLHSKTTNNKQQTTNHKQQTTNNKLKVTHSPQK